MTKQSQRLVIFSLLLCFLSFKSFSQERFSIKGIISDTSDKKVLYQASISLLRSTDSSLYAFSRADKNGAFVISNLTAQQYIILVTYPGYASLIDKTEIQNKDLDLGNLSLSTKVKVLQEIVLKNKAAAIRMKGDTTEYTADSFKVAPNADVQELLRSMPNFQVNSRGEIITQGEKVNKVLVDGEEFFSDDPAVVTKNIRADIVDKVQVFDKKSDQAVFTGIDDGQRTKTINLKLKEDKTKGYFGKVDAGSNFNSLNTAKLMANLFQGKKKVAAYFTTDNTRFEGLSWDDLRNYSDGGNITTEVMDGGGISISMTSDDDYSENRGLPNQQTAGALFANKKGNTTTSNSVQFQHLGTVSNGITDVTTLLTGTTQQSRTTDDQVMDKRRYKFNTVNQWGTDSTGLFKTVFKGAHTQKEATANYLAETMREDESMLNSSSRSRTFENIGDGLDASLTYRRKLAKKGRTISFSSSFNINSTTESGSLLADNFFYDPAGTITSRERIDQQKKANQNSNELKTGLSYTEPVGKNSFLVFQYNLGVGRNEAERNTFGKGAGGTYVTPIDSLSNHFIYSSLLNSGGLSYKFVKKKLNLSFGTAIGQSLYKLNDVVSSSKRNIDFFNFLPSASITFSPAAQRRLYFTYNGVTSNPQLTQLQPLRDNTDPLNLTVGNPTLKQGFSHNFNINANDYKVLKNRSIGLWGSFSYRQNGISTSTDIDVNGRRITQYINVDGTYNGNISLYYGIKVYKSLNASVRTGFNKNRSINFINSSKNITNYTGVNYTLDLNMWGEKWLTFYTSLTARKNFTNSSVFKNFNGDFWSYNVWGQVKVNFKKAKLFIELEPSFSIFQRTSVFPEARNSFLLSPAIRKVWGKSDAWELRLYVFDMLNENRDANRSVSTNFLSASTVNTFKRFALLGLTYNFSKNGKPTNSGF